MFKKTGFGLLFAASLFSADAMAMNHELQANMTVSYELAVDTPELFTNYTMFKVKAVCYIEAVDSADVIHVKAVRRSGTINGQALSTGDTLDIIVKNGDKLQLAAESAAQVEITNKGDNLIKALCKTV